MCRFLRVDTLSLLLSMANVGVYSDVLVVDMVGGIVVGAVAERLGGIVTHVNKGILTTLPEEDPKGGGGSRDRGRGWAIGGRPVHRRWLRSAAAAPHESELGWRVHRRWVGGATTTTWVLGAQLGDPKADYRFRYLATATALLWPSAPQRPTARYSRGAPRPGWLLRPGTGRRLCIEERKKAMERWLETLPNLILRLTPLKRAPLPVEAAWSEWNRGGALRVGLSRRWRSPMMCYTAFSPAMCLIALLELWDPECTAKSDLKTLDMGSTSVQQPEEDVTLPREEHEAFQRLLKGSAASSSFHVVSSSDDGKGFQIGSDGIAGIDWGDRLRFCIIICNYCHFNSKSLGRSGSACLEQNRIC
ncbi:hypothetical protein Taro_022947 [Colocasia esculenta]|uniref:tRNA (adenine(58)-N(1))-methyltransferase non-catalytic subunit TRM6 n=1 Tax=Colocasia esculenta TaxID=4460 RepID=A0A843V6V3_COLES|nr:hypothetical protein [Colocasia esculenta]